MKEYFLPKKIRLFWKTNLLKKGLKVCQKFVPFSLVTHILKSKKLEIVLAGVQSKKEWERVNARDF